jgi:uncharacterized protein YdaU (DUF1376 family)
VPGTKIRRVDFYPADWLVGTIGLPHEEIAVYVQICMLIYDRGGPIPDDEAWLSHVAGMHWRTFRKARIGLIEKGKIVSENGHVSVRRCSEELQRAFRRVSESRQNGTKGNKIRWNGVATRSGVAIANNQQPATSNQQVENTLVPNSAPKRRSYTENAERFWDVYPHRAGADPKKPAIEVFEAKVRAGADPEEIILGAERYASYIADEKLEARFVPQAQKWLRQEYYREFSDLGPSQHAPQQSRRPNGLPEDYEEVRRRLEQNC